MSDMDFTDFIQEVRAAIQEIRRDVRRIENELHEAKQYKRGKRRWYNWWT